MAKDFKRCNDPDLYSATPPIEMLRMIVSIAATGLSKNGTKRKIMVNDVARAYFNAPNLTPVYVEICDEDREAGDEEMCGELLVSMYGTRPAASNWHTCYTKLLEDSGFIKSRASPCVFYHSIRDIDLIVHGDDFVSTGAEEDLQWLRVVFETKFELSTDVIGPEEKDSKVVKVLNRIISVSEHGYTYEADARHAEIIIRDLGLSEAKGVSSPWSEEHFEEEELLDHERFKRYQSICARANFLVLDRIDIQFATKECCRSMAKPTITDWARLKRLGDTL